MSSLIYGINRKTKMIIKKFAVPCVLSLTLTACMTVGSKFDPNVLDSMQPGVTTLQDASTSLGKPTSISAAPGGGTLLQWIYSQGSLIGGSGAHIAVLFDKDGKMVRMIQRTKI